jgi:hypothetical protein
MTQPGGAQRGQERLSPEPVRMAPMPVGQVLGVGLAIVRRRWPTLLVLALLFAGPGSLLSSATGLQFLTVAGDVLKAHTQPGTGVIDPDLTLTQAELDRIVAALVPYLLGNAVAGVLLSLGALAFSAVVEADYFGRRGGTGPALRACLRRTPSALAFMALTSLLIIGIIVLGLLGTVTATAMWPSAAGSVGGPGAFLALVAIVAMAAAVAYLTMRWAPAFPVMVVEDAGWRKTLRRAWFLSGDNVLRILLVSVVGALITAVAGSVITELASILLVDLLAPNLGLDTAIASTVAGALGSTLLAPVGLVFMAVLYFDLRARRDSIDPHLSAAGA